MMGLRVILAAVRIVGHDCDARSLNRTVLTDSRYSKSPSLSAEGGRVASTLIATSSHIRRWNAGSDGGVRRCPVCHRAMWTW